MVESRVHVDVTCLVIDEIDTLCQSRARLSHLRHRRHLLSLSTGLRCWTGLTSVLTHMTSHHSLRIAIQRSEERSDCQKAGISTDMILYFATCPTCSQTDGPLSSNRNPLDHLTQDDRPNNAGKLKGPLWNASRCFLSATSCFLTSMIHSDRV